MGVAHEVVLRTISSGPAAPTRLHVVVVARPEGFERTPPTIVIEGVDELVKALRAA
jgi:hypothetical protein